MSTLEKITLKERLSEGPLPVSDVISLGLDLMTTLKGIHEKGEIHGSLRPEDIFLVREGTSWRGKFPKQKNHHPSKDPNIARYLSPEQTGVLNYEVDARSDFFSAGVVLYECLSGKCPISGDEIGEVLRQQVAFNPAPILQNGMPIPHAMEEFVFHLLSRDPNDRYQSETAAQKDLESLREFWQSGQRDPDFIVGRFDTRRELTEPAFIGRKSELSELQFLLEDAQQGKGGLVFLEAESGGGKTKLLQEFARRNSFRNVWTAWGQGLDQAAQRPFQVLVGLAQSILVRSSQDGKLKEVLKRRLGDYSETVAIALPELKRVLEIPEQKEKAPEGFGQIRSLEALTRFLDSLGTESEPALLLLDDFQWADEFTLKLLKYWMDRKQSSPLKPCYTLIIAAFRSEEVSPGHPLRAMTPDRVFRLKELKTFEVEELVSSMAGPVPSEIPALTSSLCGGSPFMATAVMRGIVELGALFPGSHGWEIESTRMGNIRSSSVAAEFLVKRLELLPPKTLSFLSAGAVLGKIFEVPLAMKLTNQTQEEANLALQEGTKRHILWVEEEGKVCNFVHDKIRESLLSRFDPSERKRLHRSAAEHLEKTDQSRIFEIAFHYDAAGDAKLALPFAIAAAERARSQHSLEVADQQYRIAERGLEDNDIFNRKFILEGLGDVLLLRGSYDAAEKEFLEAASLVDDTLEKARFEGKLGELEFKRGNVEKAGKAIERGLRLLGVYVPSSTFTAVTLVFWEVAVQCLHTVLPSFFVGRRKPHAKWEKEFAVIRLLSRLAYVYWFQKGKLYCAWTHFKEMNLAERYTPTPELAQAYSEHAPVMTLVPYFRRAMVYAEKSLAMRKEFGDLWGQGQSLHFYGVALYGASRFEECIVKCREAARLLDRMGDKWEVNTANWHIGFALYRQGKLKEAVDMFRFVYQSGKYIGDHQATAISISGWSKASHGRIAEDLVQVELERSTGDMHTRLEILQGQAIRLMAEDKSATAAKLLKQTYREVKDSGFQSEYVAPVLPLLATALRLEIEKAKREFFLVRYEKLMKQLNRVTKKAVSIARQYRNNLPHALRERAIYLATRGKIEMALRLLKGSQDIARSQSANHELLQTLLIKDRLYREIGKTFPPEETSEIQKLVAYCDVPSSVSDLEVGTRKERQANLSLIDRFDTVIEIGRQIASLLSKEEIFRASEKACQRLFRADTCLILMWNAERNLTEPIEGSTPTTYSEEMVRYAIASGKTSIFAEETPHPAASSLQLLGVKSALCTPIFIRKKIVGCFYLVHHQIGTLFGEEEERLSGFVATLTGAALENAEGFEELLRLNKDLEHRMEEQKIVEGKLQKYATQLKRSNSDLEQFAYVASHDLKEPLRMVTSYVQLLAEAHKENPDPEIALYVKFAVEGAKRMADLIEALLTYSRIGVVENPPSEVDFNEIAQIVINNLEATIREKGAKVTFGNLPIVLADKIPMIQVLQNLVGNALKFRGPRVPQVHIEAKLMDGEWRFAVSDNGIGIEPQYLERIFIIFQRLHQREEYPGTGIGLSVCKKTVQQYGGRIWVESQVGVGSTFYFTLPERVLEKSPENRWPTFIDRSRKQVSSR